MPVKIKSTGGGSVTIDVPSTAVDTTILLPVANGVTLFSNSSPVLSGNVAVSGSGSYINLNGDTLSPYSMKNRIINGDFNFWQRGTTFTVVNSVNTYSADRFRTEGYGANTTISQQAFAGGQTDVPDNPTYFCRVALTSVNSSGYWAFQQRVESPQIMRAYGTYTLSFWARATTGTVSAGAWNYGINAPIAGPALTTTWQKVTQTVTLSSAASETAGYVTIYLVYLAQNSPAVSIDIAHVQLEAGPTATSFEYRPFPLELSMCQRYCEKSYALNTVPGTNTGVNTGEWVAVAINSVDFYNFGWGTFKVNKRGTTTLSLWSTDGTANSFRQQDASNVTASVRMATETAFSLYGAGMTTNNYVRCHWLAVSEL